MSTKSNVNQLIDHLSGSFTILILEVTIRTVGTNDTVINK